MSNRSNPVQIEVPGPHLGGNRGWTGAALNPAAAALVGDRAVAGSACGPQRATPTRLRGREPGPIDVASRDRS